MDFLISLKAIYAILHPSELTQSRFERIAAGTMREQRLLCFVEMVL